MGKSRVDEAAIFLGSEVAVDEPLLIPGRFESLP
jgi:hypothetical protein